MHITLRFQKVDSQAPQELELSADQYFDPLEAGESFEKDGVPKFSNDWHYLRLEPSELLWSQLEVRGESHTKKYATQYSAGGQSVLVHRKDSDGWEEIIASTRLSPYQVHILRVHRDSDAWVQNTNVLITTHADGTQSETAYHRQPNKTPQTTPGSSAPLRV
jgi:hypothetical protein